MTTATPLPSAEALSEEAPLVRRLVDVHGACWVDPDSLDGFTALPGDQVLFFSGDPVRFPEGQDVAVVLPELRKAFPDRFGVGVVRRSGEDAVARVWGVQRWPSLVFLRDGKFVTTVSGMLDWTDYVERVGQALSLPTSRAPIPLVGASAGSGCH